MARVCAVAVLAAEHVASLDGAICLVGHVSTTRRAAFRAPMAYAVIGGLVCSTALSLVFVPAMFVLMDNVSRFSLWLGSLLVGKSEQPDALKDASRGPPAPQM
jgi:hypothetical protein